MATEVKHGPHPGFTTLLQPGSEYHATITGHYTMVDGLAAAGVSEVVWQSDRAIKRQAELLSLRSAFLGWFLETYLAHGGTWQQAVAAIKSYPFPKVRAALKTHADPNVARWAKEPTAKQREKMGMREGRETPVNRNG